MAKLLLLFIVVPAVELSLLIEIGKRIGTPATLALIVVTGIVGASLARWQGLSVLRQVQQEMAAGRVPAVPLADGVMILLASAVLMTPGILTDIFGFLLLVPAVRTVIRRNVRRRFERAIQEGRATLVVERDGPWRRANSDDFIDVEATSSGTSDREIAVAERPERPPGRNEGES